MTAPQHPFVEDLRSLERHYTRLFSAHGDSPAAAQWRDRQTQEKRWEVLAQVGDLQSAKVLDFGCGLGHLYDYLRRGGFRGEYVGYDLCADILAAAATRYPECRFARRDVLHEGMPEMFDYVLISGIFNNKVSDNTAFLKAILRSLFPHCVKGLAFNALSTYVDYVSDELSYFQPEATWEFCKTQLSPLVTLRHDYQVQRGVTPYEFTIYIYRAY